MWSSYGACLRWVWQRGEAFAFDALRMPGVAWLVRACISDEEGLSSISGYAHGITIVQLVIVPWSCQGWWCSISVSEFLARCL